MTYTITRDDESRLTLTDTERQRIVDAKPDMEYKVGHFYLDSHGVVYIAGKALHYYDEEVTLWNTSTGTYCTAHYWIKYENAGTFTEIFSRSGHPLNEAIDAMNGGV